MGIDQPEGIHWLFLVKKKEGDRVDCISNDSNGVSVSTDDALDFSFGADGVPIDKEFVVEVEPCYFLTLAAVGHSGCRQSNMLVFLWERLVLTGFLTQDMLSFDNLIIKIQTLQNTVFLTHLNSPNNDTILVDLQDIFNLLAIASE